MKKSFFIVMVIIIIIAILSCSRTGNSVTGNGEVLTSSYIIELPITEHKDTRFNIGDSVFVQHTFNGYQSEEANKFRLISVIEDSTTLVHLEARVPYGEQSIRFYSKTSSTSSSWNFLNPLGILLREEYSDGSFGDSLELKHYEILSTEHENGHIMPWGIATKFNSGMGEITSGPETPMIDFVLVWDGIPDSTYINGELVAFPDSLVGEFTENISDGLFYESSFTGFMPHYVSHENPNLGLRGSYPINGYFSFDIRDENGRNLYMGITMTTSQGSCECMNIYDYYEGEEHHLRFLLKMVDGVPTNEETIDYRIGNQIDIGFGKK